MENMELYEAFRKAPDNALRTIQAGKLKGKTDINPMWRIKVLTERFGPCGIGWNTRNVKYWTEPGAAGEILVFCTLELVYRTDSGEWSDPVHGIGGNTMVATMKGALQSNDDAYKSAYTDAISVAAKALGVAADVYWNTDTTKYTQYTEPPRQQQQPSGGQEWAAEKVFKDALKAFCTTHNKSEQDAMVYIEGRIGHKLAGTEDYLNAQKIVNALAKKAAKQ